MDAWADMLIQDMRAVFGADHRRIAHALAVLEHAERIRAVEGGDPLVIQAAALLHDIGIPEAERKYQSAAGRYQEIEGPPLAAIILRRRALDEGRLAHVCRIIAHHHSVGDMDTLEFRVLWDADWLVNLPDLCRDVSDVDRAARIDRIFKTATGRETALRLFAGPRSTTET